MRRMIAAENFYRAVGDRLDDSLAISRRAQRGVHFAVGVISRPGRKICTRRPYAEYRFAIFAPKLFTARDRGIGQCEMVRTSFARDRNVTPLCVTQQFHTAGRA